MYLSRGVAERITEHIAANLKLEAWVVDRSAQILAATHPQGDGSATFQAGGNCAQTNSRDGRLSLPLHYADQQIGALVVATEGAHSTEIVNAAKVMAEMIIRQMADVEQLIDHQWALNRFVYDLLLAHFSDRPPEAILREASLLGIDLTLPRVVGMIHVAPLLNHLQRRTHYPTPNVNGFRRQRHQLRRQLLRQSQEYLCTNEATTLSFLDEQYLIVLAVIDPGDALKWRRDLESAIQRFIDEVGQSADPPLSAGVGDYYGDWQTLPTSYRDAQLALQGGHALHGGGRVYALADIGFAAFVCADETIQSRRTAQILHPLLPYPDLLETLDVFLRFNLSPSLAAEQLHIHRHTLTYRLGRIARLTGLNPTEFAAAAQLYAALVRHRLNNNQP